MRAIAIGNLSPYGPHTSEQFQRLMADHGITCSMSRSGIVWDNAAMESLFSSLKTERTTRKEPETMQGRRIRLHRTLLQPEASAFDTGPSRPDGI
jgi:transposase InsO family protein